MRDRKERKKNKKKIMTKAKKISNQSQQRDLLEADQVIELRKANTLEFNSRNKIK